MVKHKVPPPDERMKQTIEKIGLTDADIGVLYKRFMACDDEVAKFLDLVVDGKFLLDFVSMCQSGSIDLNEFYESFHEKKSAFGNAIFNLIDCDNSGQLDFSEYVAALSTFCVFGRDEILKFCFYVFDDDKNGTIEGEELTALLELLHQDGQSSNLQVALEKFNFNADGKIDFAEFKLLNAKFPSLLYPAFRMQENMKKYTLGTKWWQRKVQELDYLKNKPTNNPEKDAEDAANKKLADAARLRMGCCQYYCCPCRRARYRVTEDSEDENDNLSEEKKRAEMEAKAKAKALRKIKEEEDRKRRAARKEIDENLKNVGKRQPLSKEQRMERARRRRMRDMAARPGRK